MKETLIIVMLLLLVIPLNAKKYYISNQGNDSNTGLSINSPWKTLAKINNAELMTNDSVLFRSDDSWFGQLIPKSGSSSGYITYGAYGYGEKPLLNHAIILNNSDNWTQESTNLWKTSVGTTDIGNILLNNSMAAIKKWNKSDLNSQGYFWYDRVNNSIYLYSLGNPSTIYSDIKCLVSSVIVNIDFKSYFKIENLAIKYSGQSAMGNQHQGANHIIYDGLDIAWCGGAEIGDTHIRMGNGIEFWGNCNDILVQNCKIWECYDAGITNQFLGLPCTQENIIYRNNQIWNCEYSYEYFNRDLGGISNNIVFENNTCLNAGFGWAHNQRPDPSGYHLRLAGTPTNTSKFIVRNNIFDTASNKIIYLLGMGMLSKLIVDYNCVREQSCQFATGYSTWTNYIIGTGWDTHSLNTDPMLNDNKSLQTNSPCIKRGAPSTSIDLFGFRNDIGCHF